MPSSSDTYLHGHHDSVLRSHRWRTAENSAGYLLPQLRPDARVLDVGCGPGTITADLAALVPDGDVTGIDAVDGVLAEAQREAERRDVVHAHQVLQHLTDPVAALREMRRVCRPGGLVAARDGDYGGIFWFPPEPGLTEWQALYRAVARAIGGEPDAGRHLHAWARQAGFTSVRATASAWCYTGPEERVWWGNSWAERLTDSPFGDRAVEHGLATREDLERLAGSWRHWSGSEDAWFVIPHGEILCEG
jgi:SAM-dependent methyltransferase